MACLCEAVMRHHKSHSTSEVARSAGLRSMQAMKWHTTLPGNAVKIGNRCLALPSEATGRAFQGNRAFWEESRRPPKRCSALAKTSITSIFVGDETDTDGCR